MNLLVTSVVALFSLLLMLNRGGMLPYKVVVRYVDSEEAFEQFDLLHEVLDYLSTHMAHVSGRKDVIGILILKED